MTSCFKTVYCSKTPSAITDASQHDPLNKILPRKRGHDRLQTEEASLLVSVRKCEGETNQDEDERVQDEPRCSLKVVMWGKLADQIEYIIQFENDKIRSCMTMSQVIALSEGKAVQYLNQLWG